MGCCASTTKTKNAATKTRHLNDNKKSSLPKANNTCSSRTPPPTYPLIEEETVVKEVLSETPSLPTKPNPTISRFNQNDPKKAMLFPPSALQQQQQQQQQKQQLNDGVFKKPRMVFNPDEPSEDASEICSSTLSECVSTATEKREAHDEYDDDVSKIRQRSPAKYRNRHVSGERQVGKSPARRSEPSPGRVRSGPGRDANGLVGNGQRRGSSQSSDRRSRSPATRVDVSGLRTGLGRCPSVRRTGKSPGRVGSGLSEKIRKMEDGNGNRENKWPPTSNESLENPLVSLECFIFL